MYTCTHLHLNNYMYMYTFTCTVHVYFHLLCTGFIPFQYWLHVHVLNAQPYMYMYVLRAFQFNFILIWTKINLIPIYVNTSIIFLNLCILILHFTILVQLERQVVDGDERHPMKNSSVAIAARSLLTTVLRRPFDLGLLNSMKGFVGHKTWFIGNARLNLNNRQLWKWLL